MEQQKKGKKKLAEGGGTTDGRNGHQFRGGGWLGPPAPRGGLKEEVDAWRGDDNRSIQHHPPVILIIRVTIVLVVVFGVFDVGSYGRPWRDSGLARGASRPGHGVLMPGWRQVASWSPGLGETERRTTR